MKLCAHRGFSAIAPENSLPAYGAAVALGADEIEFDLWSSRDGVIVSCHDARLERLSNGEGWVWQQDFAALRQLDFGSRHSPELAGLTIPTFEEILQRFAGKVTLAVHVKDPDNLHPLPDGVVEEIVRLIRAYSCTDSSYFICGNNALLAQLTAAAPEIPRCVIHGNDPMEDLMEKCCRFHAARASLYPPYFRYYDEDYVRRTIARAHELGMTCNIDCNDPALAVQYAEWGADTLVTDRLLVIRQALQEGRKSQS